MGYLVSKYKKLSYGLCRGVLFNFQIWSIYYLKIKKKIKLDEMKIEKKLLKMLSNKIQWFIKRIACYDHWGHFQEYKIGLMFLKIIVIHNLNRLKIKTCIHDHINKCGKSIR